jgi:hypothetical protein
MRRGRWVGIESGERGEGREKRLERNRGRGRACLVSPAKRNADHCGVLVAWACVEKRNARVGIVYVQRSTGALVVACAMRRALAYSVRDSWSSNS